MTAALEMPYTVSGETRPLRHRPIYEVGQHDGRCYLSMVFLEGQSLSHRRAEGPFPPREAAELMVMVAEAIE
jgi:hypothetical protein